MFLDSFYMQINFKLTFTVRLGLRRFRVVVAGNVAESVKSLPCKCEDLSSDEQHCHNKPGLAHLSWLQGGRDKRIPGACQVAKLATL